jgi:hypothetical protein
MLRLHVLVGLLLVLAVASGTAEAREAPLRLVRAPVVVYDPGSRSLDVSVRLNRPLKHNIGHPSEYVGHRASLEVVVPTTTSNSASGARPCGPPVTARPCI